MTNKPVRTSALILLFSVLVASLWAGASVARPRSVDGAPRIDKAPPIEKVDFRRLWNERAKWVDDELLVRFKGSVDRSERARAVRARGATVKTQIQPFDVTVVDLPDGESVLHALERFRSDPQVEEVEPNYLIYPDQVIPTDPRFDEQWGLHNTGQQHRISDPPPEQSAGTADADIDAPEAWVTQTGTPQTVIAVLDSGVDVNHPDLNSSIWTNPDEIPNNGLDDDGNGYADDVKGWDFAEEDRTLLEPNEGVAGAEHGTLVAGVAAAEMNNGTGIAGTCPGCRIMVLKFMRPRDTDGDLEPDTMLGSTKDELEAIAYAIKEDADVLNASFSSFVWSGAERRAFKRLGKSGTLAVAAAGNSNLDNDMLLSYQCGESYCFSPEYPASFDLPRIVSVAASNHRDQYGYFTGCDTDLSRASCAFTSWGHESVDLAAPGVDIMSTSPGGYGVSNGTSFSAPYVSGVAGLLKSRRPALGPMQLKNAIMNGVDRPDTLRKLWAFNGGPVSGRFTKTNGRLNAHDALTAPTTRANGINDGNIRGARRLRRLRKGNVDWPEDVNDVFKKQLRRGRTYRIVLNGPDDQDFDLLVWKPKTKEIWQYENGCFPGTQGPCKLARYAQKLDGRKADEVVTITPKKRGRYYIHVSAWLRKRGNYRLRIHRI